MKLGILNFLRDIINFLRAGSVLGIDIGTTSIKLAEIAKKGVKFKLLNYGILTTKEYLEHPNEIIQTSSLEIVEEKAAELLRILLNEVKPKSKTVVASLPAFSSFITLLDMPLMKKEETEKSVAFQARQYIPLPINQVSIDWIKVEEFEGERGGRFQRVLLIGIPNSIIKKYKNIFKIAGLRLVALEVESLALVRALGNLADPTLVIDIGGEATNIAVTEDGILKYAFSSDYGGIHLSQALSKSLGISIRRAEELKRHRGLTGREGEAELSTLISPFLDVIIQEVRYARDFYENRYKKKVQDLMLVGGGANLEGIKGYFASQLNLKVKEPAISAEVEYDLKLEAIVKNLWRELALASGLAKKYFT